MKKPQNNSVRPSAPQITFWMGLISILAISLATAQPNPQDAPQQSQGSKPVRAPVAVVALPNQTIAAAGGDFVLPVTVSKIDPAVHGNLQAFQGDFTYDSSVVAFQNNPVTAGAIMSNNGGQWSLMANPNLTHTDAPVKTLRVTAFCVNNVGLSTDGASSNTLFTVNLTRVSKKTGASTAITWGTPPNSHFRFFDVEGFDRIPASTPPGKLTVRSTQSR